MRILLIDDHSLVLSSISNALELFNHQCDAFQSPKMALEMVDENRYDVAIVDYSMIEMNGVEVINVIHEKDAQVKLILMSGYGDVASEVLSQGQHVHAFFTKPLKIVNLIETLEQINRDKYFNFGELSFHHAVLCH